MACAAAAGAVAWLAATGTVSRAAAAPVSLTVVTLRPAPRGQASISRNDRKNTPPGTHSVRTTDAAKSERTALAPARARTGATAAGSPSPAGGLQDAGVTVGSAATSRSCRQ